MATDKKIEIGDWVVLHLTQSWLSCIDGSWGQVIERYDDGTLLVELDGGTSTFEASEDELEHVPGSGH